MYVCMYVCIYVYYYDDRFEVGHKPKDVAVTDQGSLIVISMLCNEVRNLI